MISSRLLDIVGPLAEQFRANGHELYLVGGIVRDELLARGTGTWADIDLTTDARPDETKRLVAPFATAVWTQGERFGTIGCYIGSHPFEITTFRGEAYDPDSRKPTVVFADALDSDLSRRDFTINAIAWDPLTGGHVDPFDGRRDLELRVLRVVDPETFADDSLRVLRAVQFAARFEMSLDPEAERICRGIALDDLPAERVWGEIEKLLLQAARPSIGFRLAERLGVIAQLFPECGALIGCEQEPEWHPEGDVWTHTLMVIDGTRARIDDLPHPQRVAMMLGAVAHDFGKPATTVFADGRIRSPNHEEAGVAPALAFLDRLNIHTLDGYDVRKQVVGLVANHLKPGMWHKSSSPVGDGAFRRLAQKVDLELLARLAEADCVGRTGEFDCGAMAWFLERARALVGEAG